MNTLLYTLDGNHPLQQQLVQKLSVRPGRFDFHQFPDGETYLRVYDNCIDKQAIILCSLNQPNNKVMPLLILLNTLRQQGIKRVGLIAPYLAYMRQDKQFNSGEAVSSRYFAELLSNQFDWLVTVDPHLHRYHSLDEIYQLENRALFAAPVIAKWIIQNVSMPLLVGPDNESEQWVAKVAQLANAPYIILTKHRHGDRNVEVSVPEVQRWLQHTPVLVDDIISTGHTMQATIGHLLDKSMSAPVCIGTHGIFADNSYERLMASGAKEIVTSNSILHFSNQIDLSSLIAESVSGLI